MIAAGAVERLSEGRVRSNISWSVHEGSDHRFLSLRGPNVILISLIVVLLGACSNERVREDRAVADSGAILSSANNLQPHAAALPDPITRPLVIYLEATAAELDSARRGVSDEDFAVIADDLMFYRSTALEQLEARQIPFSRISGRRPLKFVVAGSSKTMNPSDHALFDLIVVFRGDDTARIFAPNEVDQAADYWLRSSIGTDTAK